MIKQIGILSDTHLGALTRDFQDSIHAAFASCDLIVHAGDLTNVSVLDAFSTKKCYAVHGNMCDSQTVATLPESIVFEYAGHVFAVCHGWQTDTLNGERLFMKFAEADCIIFGHTHRPLIQWFGRTVIINPGSFRSSGSYGAPGTYALVEIHQSGLYPTLHEIKQHR